MRTMDQSPLLSRRSQQTSQGSAENDSSNVRVCMCSPTTHPGSFRCRYHIKLRLVQQKLAESKNSGLLSSVPAPPSALPVADGRRKAVGASRLSRMTSAASLNEQGSTEEHSGPLRFLKNVAGAGASALGLRHSSDANESVSATGRSGKIYEVKKGDTLSSIAREQDSAVDVLRAVNNLSDDTIYPDQKLWVPLTYEIQKGDTLFQISKRFKTTVGDVMKVNNIKDQNSIQAGDILLLP